MAPRKHKQDWRAGDVFLLPLNDGDFCIGRVVSKESRLMNSVAITLFDQKGQWPDGADLPELSAGSVYSSLYVTRDLLDSGRWRVIANVGGDLERDLRPYEALRGVGFVGAKVRGSANVEEFANAFYGLMPWDDWYVPNYLDDFLVSIEKKPVGRIIYSGRHAT